jgi:preprotein translocase subunit SecB
VPTPPQNPGNGEALPPRLFLRAQYVKDLSFENPHMPGGLSLGDRQPKIDVNVDVQGRGLDQPGVFEVVLRLTVSAKDEETPVFMVELVYGAVFAMQNIPVEQVEPLLLIECPRLIFPFARRILADATRDGGYPPLLLEPIDFVELYRQHQIQTQRQTQGLPQGTA